VVVDRNVLFNAHQLLAQARCAQAKNKITLSESRHTDIFDAFEEIMQHAHFWNWVPDWQVAKDIYRSFPNSYSVLTPFAYTYLEELIRSTTSEYGIEIYDKHGKPKKRKVGLGLIKLAIKENKEDKPEYVELLEEMKIDFNPSQIQDEGDNRNSVVHGYMHPRYWNDESFENLVYDLAKISQYAGF
jgi:hypothetical protein